MTEERGSDNWPGFRGYTIGGGVEDDDQTSGGSLASVVLSSFGISVEGSGGGMLRGIDIKRMDAMQVVQASLFESLSSDSGKLYELASNKNGAIEIVTVGAGAAGLSDIIYETIGFQYINEVGGVMVTGGAPPSKRYFGSWEHILTSRYNARIWSDAHYLSSSCTMPEMKKYCTITYDDPQLNSQWDDGIDSAFDPDNPFEQIVSYEHRVDRGDDHGEDVSISFSGSSVVPLDAGVRLGDLLIPTFPDDSFTGHSEDCTMGLGDGVSSFKIEVEVPSEIKSYRLRNTVINKITSIEDVYIVGLQVNYWIVPDSAESALEEPSVDNIMLFIDFDNSNESVIKLTNGLHYVSGLTQGDNIGISFADRSLYASVGIGGLFGDNKTVYVNGHNPLARHWGSTRWSGVSILPIDEHHAVIVHRVLVSIGVDTPSVNIVDPSGNAVEVAERLNYSIRAIKIKSEPAVVSYNGSKVDLKAGVLNNDPTKTVSLEDTPYESALDSMAAGGAGMSITLSSLNQARANSLSGKIYSLYSESTGMNSVYTCGPTLPDIQLGQNGPNGGVIDRIEYRYTDSTSYLISVSESDIISAAKFSSLSGSQYLKRSEDVSGTGIVIQDSGSGSEFKVLIDGIGTRVALNTCSDVIRTGDRVSVLIRNNPVET